MVEMRFVVLLSLCTVTSLAVFINDVKFVRTPDRRCPYPFNVLKAKSAIHCCVTCAKTENCRGVNFQSHTGSCELGSRQHTLAVMESSHETGWEMLSENDGCSGNGDDVYTSYVDGTNVITDDAMCIQGNVSACSQSNQHFRSTLIDSWNILGVKKVRYVMYKNDMEVAFITFDGTGSDLTDWFSLSRVIDTSWSGLWNIPLDWFSLEGSHNGRRFYINDVFAGCAADITFTLAKTARQIHCNYDTQPSYPTYLYSTGPNGGVPMTMSETVPTQNLESRIKLSYTCQMNMRGMDIADYVAFYIMV